MKNLSILFLCRKNDKYSDLCKNFLLKNFKKVKIIASKRFPQKKLSLLKWKGDLILLFRSYIILKKNFLTKAKIACVNFHPSPPKYRGLGGINYAIYNEDKYFGCTAHLVTSAKIDSGKILDVKKFKLSNKSDLNKSLIKAHKNLYLQFKSIVPKLTSKQSISLLVKKSKKYKWSKVYNNKKKLDNFYIIQKDEKNLKNKIRATYLNNKYSPYYVINNKIKKIKKIN